MTLRMAPVVMALLVMAAAMPAAPAAAADADTLRLSLGACVDRALSLGEEMKDAQADRAVARARYLQARATALPQVSFSTNYTRQYESIFGRTEGAFPRFAPDTTASELERIRALEDALPDAGFYALAQIFSSSGFSSQHSWNAALTLRQKLFQGGSIWGSVAAAGHAVKAAELAQRDRQEEIILNVRAAYLDALLADRQERIAALGIEQAETHLKRVQLRQAAEQASEFELLQAEVERDNQVPLVKGARVLRQMAYLELGRLINLDAARPLTLTTPLLDDRAIPEAPGAVDTTGLVEAALEASGVQSLEEALRARQHAVTVAAAGRYPEFSLFATVSQQAFPSSMWPERKDWLRQKSAGLTVSWNVFDGFLTKGAVEEAKANKLRASDDLGRARELVVETVRQGLLELERSAADLHARSRTVQLAARALDLANLRYEEGASSLLEVSDARIAWQMAQTNEAQARRDYFAALARLERYSGRPLFRSLAPRESGS